MTFTKNSFSPFSHQETLFNPQETFYIVSQCMLFDNNFEWFLKIINCFQNFITYLTIELLLPTGGWVQHAHTGPMVVSSCWMQEAFGSCRVIIIMIVSVVIVHLILFFFLSIAHTVCCLLCWLLVFGCVEVTMGEVERFFSLETFISCFTHWKNVYGYEPKIKRSLNEV